MILLLFISQNIKKQPEKDMDWPIASKVCNFTSPIG